MDPRDLTAQGERWIETCARQLQAEAPSLTYMAAIAMAFDLYCAWPGMGPKDAASAVSTPATAVPVALSA